MAVDTQPKLSIGRVLALSWSVFAARWLPFTGLIVIAGLLAAAAIGMLFFGCIVVIETMPSAGGGFNFTDSQTAVMFVTLFAMAIAGLAILQIGAAAIAFGTVQHLRGQHAAFGRCLSHGFAVMLPVTGTACAAALIVGVPLCGVALLGTFVSEAFFLAVPVLALLLACPFVVAAPAAALERTGIGQALARSVTLTRDNYLRMLGLLLLLGAASFGGTVLLGMASDVLWDFTSLISIAVFLALGVFAAILVAVAYLELRRLKEGFGAEEIAAAFD
jgi:hypothetical protein